MVDRLNVQNRTLRVDFDTRHVVVAPVFPGNEPGGSFTLMAGPPSGSAAPSGRRYNQQVVNPVAEGTAFFAVVG